MYFSKGYSFSLWRFQTSLWVCVYFLKYIFFVDFSNKLILCVPRFVSLRLWKWRSASTNINSKNCAISHKIWIENLFKQNNQIFVHSFVTQFLVWLLQASKDERFKGIDKRSERENLFNDYMSDLRKKEKEERAAKRDQIKKEFVALLKEKSDLVDR